LHNWLLGSRLLWTSEVDKGYRCPYRQESAERQEVGKGPDWIWLCLTPIKSWRFYGARNDNSIRARTHSS